MTNPAWRGLANPRFRLSWDMPPATLAATGIRAADVPDDAWHRTLREGTAADGILDQAATLQRWAEDGTEPIRRVVLEALQTEPTWVEVEIP